MPWQSLRAYWVHRPARVGYLLRHNRKAVFPTSSKDDAVEVPFETLKAICEAVSIPVIAKPNAGMPQIDDLGNAVYSMTPADFAGYMKVLVDNGASVIGGCCGTTPEFISETAQVLGLR